MYLNFNVFLFVVLVKRSVLTLAGEIWRYRNDCYYYYYEAKLTSSR